MCVSVHTTSLGPPEVALFGLPCSPIVSGDSKSSVRKSMWRANTSKQLSAM